MNGETYEQWVAGIDIDTGNKKGRVRDDANALRFVEVVVNGPKTWSLAAALHPEVSAALDAAQDQAATEIVGWVAQHATTRVGPRGRQVQVPVERIEAAVIRHYTSRAGDPHRHLHLQINARVWAAGAWRGIHSVGIRDSIEAINGIGHAAVATDPAFRAVLAAHGFTLDPETSEIRELAPYVGAFSARTAQIRRNVDRYEADLARASTPARSRVRGCARRGTGGRGRRPARTRSSRRTAASSWPAGTPSSATSATATRPDPCRWRGRGRGGSTATPQPTWSSRSSGRSGRRGTPPTSAARSRSSSPRPACSPTPPPGSSSPRTSPPAPPTGASGCSTATDVPEHVRSLTSPQVLEVEADLIARLARRAAQPARKVRIGGRGLVRVDPTQAAVVGVLAGDGPLVVVEGAAGAGKTTALRVDPGAAGAAGSSADGGDPDVEGRRGRRRRDRRRRPLRGLADPPARLALGHRRPLDPATGPRPRPGRPASGR